ncbi:MAG: hypothetical protein ABSC13_09730, partial [Dehalococcoidia bacterium]
HLERRRLLQGRLRRVRHRDLRLLRRRPRFTGRHALTYGLSDSYEHPQPNANFDQTSYLHRHPHAVSHELSHVEPQPHAISD